jgi:hypothetical protein
MPVNRGPSFARCLAAITVAADLDATATRERATAADDRRLEARRAAVIGTPERGAQVVPRLM